MFDINLPFLKSTLSKTYYRIANSIVLVLDLDCLQSLESFFDTIDIIVNAGMQSKLSVIAWKPSDKKQSIISSNESKNSRVSINFSNFHNSNERKKLVSLYISFKEFCKKYKIIVLHIQTINDLSMENELFKNFIGYLLLKKFNTPDTRTLLVNSHAHKKDKYALLKKHSKDKRNSITLADGGTIIPGITNNTNLSTIVNQKRVSNMINNSDLKLINNITNKVLLKRRHTEKF